MIRKYKKGILNTFPQLLTLHLCKFLYPYIMNNNNQQTVGFLKIYPTKVWSCNSTLVLWIPILLTFLFYLDASDSLTVARLYLAKIGIIELLMEAPNKDVKMSDNPS